MSDVTPCIGFDIETTRPIDLKGCDDTWSTLPKPIGISCAAVYDSATQRSWTFCADVQQDGRYGPELSPDGALDLLYTLVSLMSNGRRLVTWNGLSFDFRVFAHDYGTHKDIGLFASLLALAHCDMMYQFFCETGYAVGLKAVSEALGVGTKYDGISGADAPALWAGTREDQERCLLYVGQDAKLTADVYDKVAPDGSLLWKTKSGKLQRHVFHNRTLLHASACSALPVPTPPTWLREPWERSKFHGWIDRLWHGMSLEEETDVYDRMENNGALLPIFRAPKR